MKRLSIGLLLVTGAAVLAWNNLGAPLPEQWSSRESALIQSMALSRLPAVPADPGNRVADLPQAAELGHRLYFDTRLSGNQAVACASCHQPARFFTDGRQLAVGTGNGERHTPSLIGVSHSPWFYWDGRKDSQWAQALAPLENAHEHNGDRLQISRLVTTDPVYRTLYTALFGPPPPLPGQPALASPATDPESCANWQQLTTQQQRAINQVFANVGKALAAYQRKLLPGPSRFDAYADAVTTATTVTVSAALNKDELAGLRLFIGKANCINCHNGPLLTNHEFHNTGVLSLTGALPPLGRYRGIRLARDDVFNCLGEYSDAEAGDCVELRFARDGNELVGAHKTPTLRNITMTAPYMHGGQLPSLRAVLQHYNEAAVAMLGHNEAKPLGLRPVELRQLEAFLGSLTAPLATDPKWLLPPAPLPE